ncbi:MAG: hypothetical protein Q8878_05660 [Bacillota bacterium]|nr:hypothetical protein [Bacillota bacterium]
MPQKAASPLFFMCRRIKQLKKLALRALVAAAAPNNDNGYNNSDPYPTVVVAAEIIKATHKITSKERFSFHHIVGGILLFQFILH